MRLRGVDFFYKLEGVGFCLARVKGVGIFTYIFIYRSKKSDRH